MCYSGGESCSEEMDAETVNNRSDDEDPSADLPPEFCHYRDEECELATAHLGRQSSCLKCPFPQCIYDERGGRQRCAKRLRDEEIARLFHAEGKGPKELAGMFGVSRRTIQRALKKVKDERRLQSVTAD